MILEDNELLLKDLCARLPYGVKVKFKVNEVSAIEEKFIYNIDGEYSYITNGKSYLTLDIIKALFNNHLDEIKPYLFPLSSMTEEQKNELEDTLSKLSLKLLFDEISSEVAESCVIDFYNKKHIDYRGLIPMGLAIDATGLNIY
jgi:hypothetical protein